MSELCYAISPDVFRLFPGYVRGVVVARGLNNCPSPAALMRELRQAEAGLRSRLDLERVAAEPHIHAWREAFRSFGARPGDYRSSIEALARRALRGDALPSINALVDIGNLLSLRHLIPTGGHALDGLRADLALRLATGTEDFISLGSEALEHPSPGEVIFAEGNIVLTRRWTWRQGTHTLTQLDTRAVEFNVDGLPPTTPGEVEAVMAEIIDLVGRYCGGSAHSELLTESHPKMGLGV